jgi:hypothetical protein
MVKSHVPRLGFHKSADHMPEQPPLVENPYQAPNADCSPITTADSLQIQIPMSVRIVLCAISIVFLACVVGAVLHWWYLGTSLPFVLGGIFSGMFLIGFVRRGRFTHNSARKISMSLGFIVTLFLIAAPISSEGSNFDSIVLVGMAVGIAVAAILWTIYFGLGTRSACQYFQLLCPNCGGVKVVAKDLLFHRAKCKTCGEVW